MHPTETPPTADAPTATGAGLPLDGRTVLVTGTVGSLTRDEAKDAITALGGTAAAGVSGKVDLIVLGDGAGVSKTAKARMLKIDALDGTVFADLAAEPSLWDGQPLGMSFEDYDALYDADPDDVEDTSGGSHGRRVEDPGHRVGKAVLSVVVADGLQCQVRLSCTCGHKWMRHALRGDDACPKPTAPVTKAPWRA